MSRVMEVPRGRPAAQSAGLHAQTGMGGRRLALGTVRLVALPLDHHRTVLLDAQLGPFRDSVDGHLSKRRKQEASLVPVTILPDDWTPPETPAYELASNVAN